MIVLNEVTKSMLKSGAWAALAAFFGLLQVWIDIFLGSAVQKHSVDLNKLCLSGGILIFSLTLVSTIAADYLFFGERDKFSRFTLFLAWFCPVVVSIFSILLYVAGKAYEMDQINFSLIRSCNVAALALALLYALVLKTCQFHRAIDGA